MAWLQCMGHQHLCNEHFTPSCFQWHWGVCYLQPDSVPSIFSGHHLPREVPPGALLLALPHEGNSSLTFGLTRGKSPLESEAPKPQPLPEESPFGAPPRCTPSCLVSQRQWSSQSNQKPTVPPQEATSLSPGSAILAYVPEHLVVLGPASGVSEDAATLFLTPPSPRVFCWLQGFTLESPPNTCRLSWAQHWEHYFRRCRGCSSAKNNTRQLAELHRQSLLQRESQAFTIIYGEPDIPVVLAQGSVLPTLHVKPKLLDTQTPRARDQERCYWTDDRRQRKRLGPSPLPILGWT